MSFRTGLNARLEPALSEAEANLLVLLRRF
jgi:hypothetical protein